MSETQTIENLTTATPAEIDTLLGDLNGKAYDVEAQLRMHQSSVFHVAGAKRRYGRVSKHYSGYSMTFEEALTKVAELAVPDAEKPWVARDAQRVLDRRAELQAQADAIADQIRPLNEEFRRRGGWTRAFLVTDGHVHSSMDCSTCNNGFEPTAFTWLPQYSGHDEAEIIEVAAERACTVCYPNAPVATAGPSVLMTPDERTRAEQRDAAAIAKAERLAKKIANGLTEDGSEFVVDYPAERTRYVPNPDDPTGRTQISQRYMGEKREYFKTEKAAVMWTVSALVDGLQRFGDDRRPAVAAIVEAMAAKHGKPVEEIHAELNAKAEAKIKRDKYPERVATVL